MSRTYKATGINLKSMPMGETDRLLTVLTREFGLVRAVAPGARKHKSALAGRSNLFVVNDLSIARGKNLDRISQAETIASYPGLSRSLGTLTASQYLAELALIQALSEQPQPELFDRLNFHLQRLAQLPHPIRDIQLLAHLNQGIFDLLCLAGVTPQVRECCLTQRPIVPDFARSNWRVEFRIEAGGIVVEEPKLQNSPSNSPPNSPLNLPPNSPLQTESPTQPNPGVIRVQEPSNPYHPCTQKRYLNATELTLMQRLTVPELLETALADTPEIEQAWRSIEQILRQYAQYHLGRSIRSATLMDS
jgi:DNA repair protein RecO (recombination protein O)